ncbi:MAG: ABC transporter permease [Tannerella sp.]|jgi:putative ABC transport system permease protein|nr:ABC transporter permease [Tannerella sp.]
MPSGNLAVVFRPLADMFIASSPHIEAGTLLRNSSPDGITFTVEQEGRRENFREQMMLACPNIGEVFAFDMLEGTLESLKNPDCLILPHHIARKMFGDESAVGRQLTAGGRNYAIGGVYSDFPNNALLQNIIYAPVPPDERLHDWDLGIYYTYINPKP